MMRLIDTIILIGYSLVLIFIIIYSYLILPYFEEKERIDKDKEKYNF